MTLREALAAAGLPLDFEPLDPITYEIGNGSNGDYGARLSFYSERDSERWQEWFQASLKVEIAWRKQK